MSGGFGIGTGGVGWEFNERTITAHYRTRHGVATATLSRIICEPREDPRSVISAPRLIEGLHKQDLGLQPQKEGTLSYGRHRLQFVEYRIPTESGFGSGCVAGAVIGRHWGRYHVLLVQASSRLEEGPLR